MEKDDKKMKMVRRASLLWKITWIIVVLQAIATAVMMKFLPEQMPMHFDAQGNVDRFGPKSELYILVALTAFVVMMCMAFTKNCREDMEKAEDARKRNTAATTIYVSALFSLVMALTMAGVAISLAVNGMTGAEETDGAGFLEVFMMIMNAGLGLVLILLGNVMPKTGPNGVFGVRTGWSSYNDETWARSNRIGGKVCVVTGVLVMIAALFVNYRYSMYITLGLIIVMAAVMVIVSYKVYKDVTGREKTE